MTWLAELILSDPCEVPGVLDVWYSWNSKHVRRLMPLAWPRVTFHSFPGRPSPNIEADSCKVPVPKIAFNGMRVLRAGIQIACTCQELREVSNR